MIHLSHFDCWLRYWQSLHSWGLAPSPPFHFRDCHLAPQNQRSFSWPGHWSRLSIGLYHCFSSPSLKLLIGLSFQLWIPCKWQWAFQRLRPCTQLLLTLLRLPPLQNLRTPHRSFHWAFLPAVDALPAPSYASKTAAWPCPVKPSVPFGPLAAASTGLSCQLLRPCTPSYASENAAWPLQNLRTLRTPKDRKKGSAAPGR